MNLVEAQGERPREKFAAPTEIEQATALQTIQDIYKAEIELSKKPKEKLRTAKKFYSVALATTDDLTSRYVLLQMARDVAAEGDESWLVLDAIDAIGEDFNVNVPLMVHESLSKAFDNSLTLKGAKARHSKLVVLELSFTRALDAQYTDHYDEAEKLYRLSLDCASALKDKEWPDRIVASLSKMAPLATRHRAAKEAERTLETNPADGAANRLVGEYLCTVKFDLKKGMPFFLKADRDDFRAAAKRYLNNETDWIEIGDRWWKIAEGMQAEDKSRYQLISAICYWRVYRELSGVTKARVDRAIEQISKELVKDYAILKYREISGDYSADSTSDRFFSLTCDPMFGPSLIWDTRKRVSHKWEFRHGQWWLMFGATSVCIVERLDQDHISLLMIESRSESFEPANPSDLRKPGIVAGRVAKGTH
jgi:hypothetical protein